MRVARVSRKAVTWKAVFLAALVVLFCSAVAAGKTVETVAGNNITADSMTYAGGKYYFKGDVHIVRDDMTGGADNAVYDDVTGDLQLTGNAYLVDPEIVINARKAFLNLKKKTGTLYDASIYLRKRNFYIKSPKVEKTGPGTYLLEKAVFTACDSPKPAWSITGGKMKVVVEDKVWIDNAEVKLGPVPVLYTPYFVSPVGTRRASGLLAPNAGYSTFGGLYLDIPYYWAISNNRDATFSLDYYSKRAFGGSVEGRYLEPGGFSGAEKLTYLKDWEDHVDYLYLRGSHAAPYAFANVDLANHKDFNKLYDTKFQDSERRFLESNGEAHLDVAGTGEAFLRARYFQDQLDGSEQSSVLQELPEAGFYFYPQGIDGLKPLGRPLVFNMQASAANFWREQGQTAIRLDAAPRVSYTAGNAVNLFQSAGLGFRHYDFAGPSQNIDRLVVDYDAALRSRLERTYQNGVTHYVEPTLEFVYRDLTGPTPPLVLDSLELEGESSLLQASVMNRLQDAKGEFLTFQVAEPYDTISGRLQPISLNVSASRPASISATLSYDPYKMEIENAEIDTNFSIVKAARLFVRETFSRDTNSWVHNIDSQVDVTSFLTLVNGGWYDSKAGLQEFHSEARYRSQCWGMDLVFSKKPGNTAFYVRLKLLGIGRSA